MVTYDQRSNDWDTSDHRMLTNSAQPWYQLPLAFLSKPSIPYTTHAAYQIRQLPSSLTTQLGCHGYYIFHYCVLTVTICATVFVIVIHSVNNIYWTCYIIQVGLHLEIDLTLTPKILINDGRKIKMVGKSITHKVQHGWFI